jgi:anti-sigma factor RsiW
MAIGPAARGRHAGGAGSELTCRDVAAFLLDYLEDELPARTRSRFEEHIAACLDCRAYIASYGQTVQLAREASQYPDGLGLADVPEALVQAVLGAVSDDRA